MIYYLIMKYILLASAARKPVGVTIATAHNIVHEVDAHLSTIVGALAVSVERAATTRLQARCVDVHVLLYDLMQHRLHRFVQKVQDRQTLHPHEVLVRLWNLSRHKLCLDPNFLQLCTA